MPLGVFKVAGGRGACRGDLFLKCFLGILASTSIRIRWCTMPMENPENTVNDIGNIVLRGNQGLLILLPCPDVKGTECLSGILVSIKIKNGHWCWFWFW